jgi:cell division protein FtsI (penicillin-binding protein 3)
MRFGLLTVSEILQKSSDVGAIKLAMRVGNQDLYRYLRSFGFGAPTGIELPGEASGLTKPPERWSKISIGAIAMGQEIGVTPLQLTTAASAVANGGWLVRPYIIHEVPPTGAARLRERPPGKRVLSPETAAMLQEMMTLVVNAGTARAARPEGYTAAGKTGTAQKIDPATGTYSRTDFVASFVGFVPAEEPRFTILVVLDSPRGRYHGGDIAAPVFKRIAEQALAYRNVPPLDSGQPNLIPASAKQPLQFASMDDVVDTNVAAFQDEGSGDAVPSFLGKTVRGATEESLAKDVPVELLGSGIAYRQFPLPGSPRPGGQKVLIWFRVGSAVEAQPAAQNTPSPKGPKNPAGPVVGVSPAAGGAATG